MKFLLEFAPAGIFQHLTPKHLDAAKVGLKKGLTDGSIDCFYSKIGGGAFAVVNSTSPDTLRANLRAHGINNVTVTSVDPLVDVVSGYIAAHKSGKVAALAKKYSTP